MTPEAQIQSEIDLLRSRVEDTQELYRETCALLFFRFGVTPTANKLYQYVRKGSMSAPAQALAKFWEELRDKSRVRIENPDLPETLRDTAGELIGTLWKQALASAQQELEIFRSESRAAVQAAEQEKQRANSELEAARRENQRLRAQAAESTKRLEQAQGALIEERTQKIALDAQWRTTQTRLGESEKALTAARQDFASELEKMRQALALAEERCQTTEKRALLAIDQERTALVQAQRELQQTRQAANAGAEQQRREIARLEAEAQTARQQLASAQATNEGLRASGELQSTRLLQLSTTLAGKETRLELLAADLQAARQALAKNEAQLLRLRSAARNRGNVLPGTANPGNRRRKVA